MHGHVRSIIFISTAAVAGILALAVAYGTFGSDTQEPLPDGLAQKATEAAMPTPTAVPPVAECPADSTACQLAVELQDAGRRGDLTAMLARAKEQTRDCPANPSVALQPLCSRGGRQAGFFTGAKGFSYVDRSAFAEFVREALPEAGQQRLVDLSAIACPGDISSRNCAEFFGLSYRVERDGVSEMLVLWFVRDEAGEPSLIGARRVLPGTPAARGGPDYLGQEGMPFKGDIYWVPWQG